MAPSPPKLPELRLTIRVQGRHPRFFRKQVRRPEQSLPAGGLVFVRDREGRPVGTGFYNPRSQIALRLIDRGPEPVGPDRVLRSLAEAIGLREGLLDLGRDGDAYRLVHAEGDGIPGLVLDRLGDCLVAQVLAKGIEPLLEDLGEALLARYPGAALVLQVDEGVRAREGLERRSSPPAGPRWIQEDGLGYLVDPGRGHKTGFFCDQRDNRRLVGRLAAGRRVLDLCCHAGGFAMHAARAGAREVRAFDLDEDAVALARTNAERNRLAVEVAHGDAFEVLRELDRGAADLVVLDPPKWIDGPKQVDAGLVRYRDLNRLALERLAPGALLVTCSCSGALGEDRFLAMLRDAAAAAGRDVRVLTLRGAGPDHPVALECPETRYLKVAFLEVRG